jgi:hypothetical protein
MKFSEQFEYHKIPEWYSEYMDYKGFKERIKHCKTSIKGMHQIFGNANIIRWGSFEIAWTLHTNKQALGYRYGSLRPQ